MYSRKGAKPAKEKNETVAFKATKNTFHLCVLGAFARVNIF
jgi:hypothetical protein